MDDLVQFLRARLDEDEQTARASKPGPWHADGGEVYATHPVDRVTDYSESAEHIARHDPARVLAEVDAKRRILRWHTTPHTVVDGFCADEGGPCTHQGEAECTLCGETGCTTLRLLALPYADHPDYRDEWRL